MKCWREQASDDERVFPVGWLKTAWTALLTVWVIAYFCWG